MLIWGINSLNKKRSPSRLLTPCAAPPFQTLDPFLFCVYHKDQYPPGNTRMEAPRVGNGADFDPSAPYRMYHGDRIPGFPQHPHRGFETITATMEGVIDHTDSMGNGGRYGDGDLQWMTAGGGVVHGEMFPLVNQTSDNPTRFFQIWLNLPAKNKMCDPSFKMHWAQQVNKVTRDDGSSLTLFAGEYKGLNGEAPPPNSWAANPSNEVSIYHITLPPNSKIKIPSTATEGVNRTLYMIEGTEGVIDGVSFKSKVYAVIDPSKALTLSNPPTSSSSTEFLVLSGVAISEPVAQRGPFVMNTQSEIMQAFRDYQSTQFGGWPWPEDAMVFEKEKGRFAFFDGVESTPDDVEGKRREGISKAGEL